MKSFSKVFEKCFFFEKKIYLSCIKPNVWSANKQIVFKEFSRGLMQDQKSIILQQTKKQNDASSVTHKNFTKKQRLIQ